MAAKSEVRKKIGDPYKNGYRLGHRVATTLVGSGRDTFEITRARDMNQLASKNGYEPNSEDNVRWCEGFRDGWNRGPVQHVCSDHEKSILLSNEIEPAQTDSAKTNRR